MSISKPMTFLQNIMAEIDEAENAAAQARIAQDKAEVPE